MVILRSRQFLLALALACLGASLLIPTSNAQDDAANPPTPAVVDDQPTPSPTKTYLPYRRVPSNFGKVGLSNQQREDIYIIRGRYQSEIAELKARIDELSRKEMGECESVLTEAQRRLLDQLRAASRPALIGSTSDREN